MAPTSQHSKLRFAAFTRRRKTAQDQVTVQLPNYKPLPLKWPFLVSLVLILCILIALLEYARRVLPVTRYAEEVPMVNDQRVAGPNLATTALTWIPKRTSTPWALNNSTILSGIHNTSIPVNGSVPENDTTSLASGNITTTNEPKLLHPQPSDYAVYNPPFSPPMYVTLRCAGEPGPPGSSPIWNVSYSSYNAPDDWSLFGCSEAYPCSEHWATVWHSNDASNCLAQFAWTGDVAGIMPAPPWTSESLNGPDDWLWELAWGLLEHRTSGCPWPPIDFDKCTGRNNAGGIYSATTSFQVEQTSTITTQIAATEVDIIQVVTDVSGHATRTTVQTRLLSGGVSTFTTIVTRMVTATGVVGGRLWIMVPTSAPAFTESSTLQPANTLNQQSQITVTTTEYLFTGSTSIYPGPVETLVDLAGSPTAMVSTKLDTLTDSFGRPISTLTEEIFMDMNGSPTATVAIILDTLMDSLDQPTATDMEEILMESNGSPTRTLTMKVDASTDSFGRPTTVIKGNLTLTDRATTTDTHFNDISTPTTNVPIDSLETIIDSNGIPLQTITVSPATLTNANGVTTATIEEFTGTAIITGLEIPLATSPSNYTVQKVFAIPVESTNYFVISFLPVLIAVILSILTQTINKNVKATLPFFALSKAGGALPRDSLTLAPFDLASPLQSIRRLFHFKEPLSLLCDTLALLISMLVTISSEAIGIKLYGSCEMGSFAGCFMYFNVFDGPSRAAESLMIAIAVILVYIGICLYPLRSGVVSNPWSIASTASLLSRETAGLLQSIRQDNNQKTITAKQIAKTLENRKFALGTYLSERATMEYGIVIRYQDPPRNSTPAGNKTSSWPSKARPNKAQKKASGKNCSKKLLQLILDHGFGAIFLALLCGFLILVVYYDAVQLDASKNSFERFIDSQKFGVRSLFAGCGVIISFFWDDIFSRVTKMQRYKALSYFPRKSNSLILTSSNVTVFPGLWRAVLDRDIFTSTVAFTVILSKITPLLLSNIPFRITQTWRTHTVCAWMMVSILVFMILILIWSFFEESRWPYMPVDPSTIAGNMYYLCDSPVLEDFEGTSRMNGKELRMHLRGMGKDYRFGEMIGVSGQTRIGIYRHLARNVPRGIQKSASVSIVPATQSPPSRSRTTRTI